MSLNCNAILRASSLGSDRACVEGVILASPDLKEIKRQDKIMEDYSEAGGRKTSERDGKQIFDVKSGFPLSLFALR